MEVNSINIPLDAYGHLVNRSDWNPSIANALADIDGVTLSDAHFEILYLLQSLHEHTGDTPPMRLLVQQIKLKLGEAKGNSRYLYRLFPEGPVRFGSKYAGLPKPHHCM